MSVDKNTYGIIGYDLTDVRDVILTEDLGESRKYEDLTCYHSIKNIQVFDDPMSGDYLYFGYIFFKSGDEYDDVMYSIDVDDIKNKIPDVHEKFKEYFKIDTKAEPKVIVFHEYT